MSAAGPFNLEAEQGLLGALLFDNALLARLPALAAEQFFDPVHGRIYEATCRLIRAGRLADGVTLRAQFAADEGVKQIGGVAYLMKLMEAAAPLTAQAQNYAALIADLAHRRAIVAAARDAIEAAHSGDADGEDVQAGLEARLHSLSAGNGGEQFKRKSDAIAEAVERAELGESAGISTGLARLDAMIGGWKPKLYLLGAASSMGKTTLLAALSRNIAAQGYGVAEFMLEMDEEEDGLRAAAAMAFDPDHRIASPHYLTAQRGALGPAQWAAMRDAAKASAGQHIYTDWRPGRSVAQMEAQARRLFARLRRSGVTPGAVIIDHEGLIGVEKGQRFTNLLERASLIAGALMAMPKRLGVPVIVAGQLTKEGKRADGEERLPNGDDWKYGGALIEAAHAVMLVHRKAYYAERKPEHLRSPDDWDAIKSRETTIVVDKARGGRRGQFTILMDMPSAAVWEAA